MTVGNADFARFAIRDFGRTGAKIARLQERIASGVNDPRVSADAARATGLSALRDIRARLEGRREAAEAASGRLVLADQVLTGVSGNLRDLQQIALRAANDTLTPEAQSALRIEAESLRTALVAAANATDLDGRALFSGTAAGSAYVEAAGGLRYAGSDAPVEVQLGERMVVAAGLTGAAVFGDGQDGMFGAVEDMIAALTEPMLSARASASAAGQARLDLVRARGEGEVTVTLTGPLGSEEVTLDLRADAPMAPMAAINAASTRTGVTATMEADGSGIRLVAEGTIALGEVRGGGRTQPLVQLSPLTEAGRPAGATVSLRPVALAPAALVAGAARAVDRAALALARVGSLGAVVDSQAEAIAAQRLTVDRSVAGLEDLDVAAALTRLQTLLLNQEASQQTFARISGQSLFDYIR